MQETPYTVTVARRTDGILQNAYYHNKLGATTAQVSVIPQYIEAERRRDVLLRFARARYNYDRH
jgi:hypothetical protein